MMNDEIVLPGIGKIKVRQGKNIRFLSVRMAPGRGVGKRSLQGKRTAGRRIRGYTTGLDSAEFGEDQSLRKRHGVGLGVDSEVKTSSTC
ncbi:MAG: hypothetical protein ACLU4N_19290 [Butyricimonas faecihominis]